MDNKDNKDNKGNGLTVEQPASDKPKVYWSRKELCEALGINVETLKLS